MAGEFTKQPCIITIFLFFSMHLRFILRLLSIGLSTTEWQGLACRGLGGCRCCGFKGMARQCLGSCTATRRRQELGRAGGSVKGSYDCEGCWEANHRLSGLCQQCNGPLLALPRNYGQTVHTTISSRLSLYWVVRSRQNRVMLHEYNSLQVDVSRGIVDNHDCLYPLAALVE